MNKTVSFVSQTFRVVTEKGNKKAALRSLAFLPGTLILAIARTQGPEGVKFFRRDYGSYFV